MPRGVCRVDANQGEIVDGLRRCGCRVEVLSRLGGGVPDLLVGTPRGQLMLIEVKDGTQKPSDRRLTPDQMRWHSQWNRYPVHVVESLPHALEMVGHDCTAFDIDRIGVRTCVGCGRVL